MTLYTLVPSDGFLKINDESTNEVNYAGMDPAIHAIQWYGVSGWIEYVFDPINQTKAPNTEIFSMSPYQSYISQAEAIIYARNNPQTYYSTSESNTFQGVTYTLGSPIEVTTPNTPQPPQTTTFVPPTPESFQTLYWYNNAWVISPVDPALSLPQAQARLINTCKTSGAAAVDAQGRIYSMVEFSQAADPLTLPTADYYGVTLGDYQTYIDGEIAAIEAQINAASSTADLYSINPVVDPNPN